MINESALDELFNLQQKRAAEILEKGNEYCLSGTDRLFKGLADEKQNQIRFESRAPIQIGQIYVRKGVQFIVLAAAEKAGYKVADVAEIVGNADVLEKFAQGAAVNLRPSAQSVPVLKHAGSAFTVPLRYSSLRDHILKHGGELYEVTGAQLSGPVATLHVRPFSFPEQKSVTKGPQRPDWLDRAPVKAPWSSTDSYRGW